MTKWKGLSVDNIEALIKAEYDEGLEKQAEGWAALRDLFDEKLTEMKRVHTNLSEAWTSPGGDLYLGQFQKVIDALEKGKTLADKRATAIMDAAGKIGATQRAVELLRAELDEKERTATEAYHSYLEESRGSSWDFNYAPEDYDRPWWDRPIGSFFTDEPEAPNRDKLADEGSPSINDRVNTAMTSLADEMKAVRNDSEMWEKPEYAGPKDGPAPPPTWGMVTPTPPGMNAPGMPGMPAQPGMPNIPAPPTMPNLPTTPNMPTVPTAQAPTIPNVPTIPTMPNAPGMPGVPGAPAVGSPGMPAGLSGRRPSVANPMGNSRSVAPRAGAPGAPSPTAPGKPGMSGKMAPPMAGMGPKGQKKGVKPGGPGRPGTPMGSSGIPGKPGMSGKMAPPTGGVPPKNSNKTPDRKPGQPLNPAGSSAPGKPGAVKGGKPLAGKPGGARGGGPGGSQFKAPPHIGRPRGDKKPKTESGYGKFGPPEGTPLGSAPRVTKPGGSRPVLNNRSATPTSPLGARDLGVPSNQRPAGRAPGAETDTRGVIKPAKPEPKPTTPQRPADYYEKKAMRLREDPKTAEYMDNLFKMTGLRPPVIEPAAPPKAHTAGPILGT